LTSSNEWNPYSTCFAEAEKGIPQQTRMSAITTEYMEYCDFMLPNIMQDEQIAALKLDKKNLFMNEQNLASNWGIGLTDTTNTLKVTTQNFIRSVLHPMERRFRTKNVALRYNHLKCRFYSDTFFSGV
jgi:hypothetical protein